MTEPTAEQIKEVWEWCGLALWDFETQGLVWVDGKGKIAHKGEITLDNLFKYAVPKSGMDALWIINNLNSPSPKIEFCFGYVRGKNNDLICWSKTLPEEMCLSPVCNSPEDAIYQSIQLSLKEK